MSNLDHLKPFAEKHSIREAVITLFLTSPIIQPEHFKELLSTQFKDLFQEFNILNAMEVKIDRDFNKENSISMNDRKGIGFEFKRNSEDRVHRVLRGLNDSQGNRVFFSFHTLDYDRWEFFRNEFYESMNILAEFEEEIFVRAFSIHYIDDFFWEKKDAPFPVDDVFDKSYEIIPKSFLESNNATFSLATQKEIQNNPYIERLDVQLSPNAIWPDLPSLRISHNVMQQLQKEIKIQSFLNFEDYQRMVNQAHEHNKIILRKILKPEIQKLIALNK